MIIPIRCFTCGKVMADKIDHYMQQVEIMKAEKKPNDDVLFKNFDKVHTGKILDDLGLTRYCCRRNLISNVDLSCCGVSYDGEKIYEDYPNAIVHCQSKVYSVNKSAKMYSERRINHRIHKLRDRGWEEIENKTDVNRDMKINVLFN
jgi:DNA-directed RNA polymerase subunit N (RpoN/RPB10)